MANARNRKALGEGTRRRLGALAEHRFKETARKRAWRFRERERVQSLQDDVLAVPQTVEAFDVDRSASRAARQLALQIHESTGSKGLQFQKLVIAKVLRQPLLRPALPEVVVHEKKYIQAASVCKNIRQCWGTLKFGRHKDLVQARSVVEVAVVANEPGSSSGLGRWLGMSKKAVKKGRERRQLLESYTPGEVWAKFYRQKRKDAISKVDIQTVQMFYTSETRVSPNKKDVIHLRTSVKISITHARHFLEESLVHHPAPSLCYMSFVTDILLLSLNY